MFVAELFIADSLIELVEQFIDQSDGTILREQFIQVGWNEIDLVARDRSVSKFHCRMLSESRAEPRRLRWH